VLRIIRFVRCTLAVQGGISGGDALGSPELEKKYCSPE
jgi:hypothetical protein